MKTILFVLPVFFISIFLFVIPANAVNPNLTIRDDGFSAKFVSQSEKDPIIIEAGTAKMIIVKFKNTGTKSWVNEGKNFISAYTMGPRDRDSVFFGNGVGWNSPKQISRMTGVVKPGEIGELGIFLHAPLEVGAYKEEFYLSAENWSWVKGGYFYLDIKVVSVANKTLEKTNNIKEDTKSGISVQDKTQEKAIYNTRRIGLSKKSVNVVGGERVKIVAIYQNTGNIAWNGYNLITGSKLALVSVHNPISFSDTQWKSKDTILSTVGTVESGSIIRETFYFRAPNTIGEYTFTVGLAVDDKILDNFNININVTENAPLNYVVPTFNGTTVMPIESEKPRLDSEPRIRVGITTGGTSLQFVSYEDDYTIFNGETEVGILPKSRVGIITYDGGVYYFKGGNFDFSSNNSPRLKPINNPHAVFTLINVKRPMSWAGPGDFNKYRGAFEYRKGEKDDVLYAVNDLLFEDYVKGISETARNDQFEFVKANITAARTYAYTSLGKYSFFDVLASTYDQLYLGYNVEVYNPQVANAVQATRGRMVAYKNEVITTPYFGNSGGYTKSWKSVWGGSEKPWLVPVKATYDLRDSKFQFGHGVGMSQRDANIRAKEEGLDYKKLLQYYYSGVEIVLMYE